MNQIRSYFVGCLELGTREHEWCALDVPQEQELVISTIRKTCVGIVSVSQAVYFSWCQASLRMRKEISRQGFTMTRYVGAQNPGVAPCAAFGHEAQK